MAVVLYVGQDLCRRVPLMEHAGLTVVRSKRSVTAVSAALSENPRFDAITFEHDMFPIPPDIVWTARVNSASRLVLFDNPNITRYGIDHGEDDFDLIIPTLTPPAVWLNAMEATIAEGWRLQDTSRRLLRESQDTCNKSQAVVRLSQKLRRSSYPIDLNALWRGGPEEGAIPISSGAKNCRRMRMRARSRHSRD